MSTIHQYKTAKRSIGRLAALSDARVQIDCSPNAWYTLFVSAAVRVQFVIDGQTTVTESLVAGTYVRINPCDRMYIVNNTGGPVIEVEYYYAESAIREVFQNGR